MPFSLETKEQNIVREIMELLDNGKSPSVAMTAVGAKHGIGIAKLTTIFIKMAGLTIAEYCACVHPSAKEYAKEEVKALDKQVA